jgi:hypothetical protein
MLSTYHRAITVQALSAIFGPFALETVVTANLNQDHWLRGQIGHPEYHFDQNVFAKSWAYMERNRAIVRPALEVGDARLAQKALGRLTHAGQDLYAHSNYISLWMSYFSKGKWPLPDEINPFDSDLLQGPELRSGKIYWPLEPFSWLPPLRKFIVPLLPRDSHAWMNLDGPERGPLFQYAVALAIKRTRYEYEQTVQGMPAELLSLFCGKNIPSHEV